MSAVLYDEALTAKIKRWSASTNMHIYSPEETQRVFEITADTSFDKPIQLPFICIRRPGGYVIENSNKKVLTYDGITVDASLKRSLQLNAVPIQISYQIDIYTRYQAEADEFIRNLIFNIINYPTLVIHIPYNGVDISHNANIRFIDNRVYDNSNIPERLNFGQFTRLSLAIGIDDAYIWDTRVRDNVSIDVQIECN